MTGVLAAPTQAALDRFNATFRVYSTVRRKLPASMIAQKAADVGYFLSDALTKPGKGTIRAEREAAMKTGGERSGVRVRESIVASTYAKYGVFTSLETGKQLISMAGGKVRKKAISQIRSKKKLVNLRALMIKRELNAREQGIGFSKYAARFMSRNKALAERIASGEILQHEGRYHQLLAKFGVKPTDDGATGLIVFGGDQTDFGTVLETAAGQKALAEALNAGANDMVVYIKGKLGEAWTEALTA